MKKFLNLIFIMCLFAFTYARPKNIKQIKEKDINTLNNLALDCIKSNDYELADLYLQKSLSIENNYTANIYMAKLKTNSYDVGKYLLDAYELNPTLEVIWYLVAYYSNLQRNRELGFKYYNMIIDSDTNIQHIWTAYGELGVYYSIKCNFEDADKYLEDALKLYKEHSELSVYSSSFESYDNSNLLEEYIKINNNRKKLCAEYNCKTESDFEVFRDSISTQGFEYQKKADSSRLMNLLLGTEESNSLKIGDKIYVKEYFPFIVVDRQKVNNLYYYLFDYCHLTKCYLVISEKQIELENVLSYGYTAKKNHVLEYIGNSTYESNFQDVECYMFKYHDENMNIYPDEFKQLWDLVNKARFY